jgi:sulfur-carrier protein adenylyltransferase/sulfurtransferase
MARPPLVPPGPELTPAERTRYARHLLLPDVGSDGQRRLRAARVLVVGAGGLGSPALLYLAAAGVGTIGIAEFDEVDESNLQRQVIHGQSDIGRPKADSAADSLRETNPLVNVVVHNERLDNDNVMGIFEQYDLIVDGTDNFPTRYLVGDACARLGVPHVWGSVYRFDGQVSVWWAGEGPCYACVFPHQPPPDAVPSCAVGGVLGAVCASIGSVMATEAVKLVTGIGEPLVGRLLVHDALRQTWDALPVTADPGCRVCGSGADVTRPLGWATGIQTDVEGAAEGEGSADAVGARPSIEVGELSALLGAGEVDGRRAVLLDVREAGERAIVTMPGDAWLPVGDVRAGATVPGLAAGARVYVYCKSGARSAEAVDLLRARGVDAVNVAGGVLAWVEQVDPTLPTY